VGLVREERWSEALDAFLEAHALFPSPIVRFNIGYCQRALGQYVAAIATLREFLAAPLAGAAATRREEAENYLRELESRVAHLDLALPPALAAELFVDGRRVEPAAGHARVTLDPGRHTVHARAAGYRPRFIDRDLKPGADEHLEVALERLPARLILSSSVPRAAVTIDGRAVGTAPHDAEIEPGPHRVQVTAPGFAPHLATVNLVPGATTRVAADLARLPPRPVSIARRWWFWTAAAGTLAVVGVVAWLIARPPPAPPPYEGGSLGWVVGH
jgi:hypothetical protein